MTTSTPAMPITTEAIEADLIARSLGELDDELGEEAVCSAPDHDEPATHVVTHFPERCCPSLVCQMHTTALTHWLATFRAVQCRSCDAIVATDAINFRPI